MGAPGGPGVAAVVDLDGAVEVLGGVAGSGAAVAAGPVDLRGGGSTWLICQRPTS